MKVEEIKDLEYQKLNAKEDYIATPISVLKYVTELETFVKQKQFKINELVKALEASINCEVDSTTYEKYSKLIEKNK